jgi:hypothetical protein
MEEQQHPRPAPSISPCSFYVASTVEEEDRRQRHDCGDRAEEGAEPQGEGTQRRLLWMMPRSTSSGLFRHLSGAIPRACAVGGGERDRPAGTSEQSD